MSKVLEFVTHVVGEVSGRVAEKALEETKNMLLPPIVGGIVGVAVGVGSKAICRGIGKLARRALKRRDAPNAPPSVAPSR